MPRKKKQIEVTAVLAPPPLPPAKMALPPAFNKRVTVDEYFELKPKKKKEKKVEIKKVARPELDKVWTTLYYGPRGSGKTLHQAKVVKGVLEYMEYLYSKKPNLKHAIVYSVQRFNKEINEKYEGKSLYYWDDAEELRYCPRKGCWRGEDLHRLHGAYVIFDDMATILPADQWANTPVWMRKMFAQGRHFGIRVLANCQDPTSVDLNFRRYVDMCYRFRKLIGSRDPDETKPPVKKIWGIYLRRKIKAEWLWKLGDMSDDEILLFKKQKEELAERLDIPNLFKDIWRASFHIINSKICNIYDTTQDVPEYKPTGFSHQVIYCVDPECDHENKESPNYCGYKKVYHELV